MCDYTILEPVLRVLDLPWARPGLVTASLDHAMWFHRSPPAATSTAGSSTHRRRSPPTLAAASGAGRFFTPDGLHLATVVQEGMIRTPA